MTDDRAREFLREAVKTQSRSRLLDDLARQLRPRPWQDRPGVVWLILLGLLGLLIFGIEFFLRILPGWLGIP